MAPLMEYLFNIIIWITDEYLTEYLKLNMEVNRSTIWGGKHWENIIKVVMMMISLLNVTPISEPKTPLAKGILLYAHGSILFPRIWPGMAVYTGMAMYICGRERMLPPLCILCYKYHIVMLWQHHRNIIILHCT